MKTHHRSFTVFSLALILALAVTLVIPVPPAYALTFNVNTLDDLNDGTCNAAHCSLREAIIAANNASSHDTIKFNLSGTIGLTATLPEVLSNGSLTITGGNNLITISGNGSVRVLRNSGELTLRNLTIFDGFVSDDFGGGVYNTNKLVIDNCIFSYNRASTVSAPAGGGAIYSSRSLIISNSEFDSNDAISSGTGAAMGGAIYNSDALTISNSEFDDNEAFSTGTGTAMGGGIYNSRSLTISNSEFYSNYASAGGTGTAHGGAIFSDGMVASLNISNNSLLRYNVASDNGGAIFNGGRGTFLVNDSVFHYNETYRGGGGIYNDNKNILTVINTTFDYNEADFGGGIASVSGSAIIQGSTFSNNDARLGGGIYANGLEVSNSTFHLNSASIYGGGAYTNGQAVFVNVTLVGNSATNSGGGVFSLDVMKLNNTIISNNTGGDCKLGKRGYMAGPPSHNLIQGTGNNACGLVHGVNGNLIGVSPVLGQFIGSPAYFTLANNSPAIDAGSNGFCAASPVNNTSQNGVTRPQGAQCDIGSYEMP